MTNPVPRSRRSPLVRSMALLLGSSVASLAAQEPVTDPFVGIWQGKVTLPGQSLELVLHVKLAEGGHTATLDSPQQGAQGIPVKSFVIADDTCTADVRAIGAKLTLRLERGAPDRLVGKLLQRGMSLPTDLARTNEVRKQRRPQEPKPPFPYRSEDVAYHHDPARPLAESFGAGEDASGVTLAGTLTLPEGKGPFPAAVMITGIGAQDRDQSLLGHKPFLVIADALTRAGLAVLRVDDRGTGKSTGSFAEATSADFARDALAGLHYLKSRAEIDPERIGLIGHSEGGLVAPMVAAGEGRELVAFAVLIAPPAVPLDEVILHQSRLMAQAEGAAEAEREIGDQLTRAALRIVAGNWAPAERKQQLREAAAHAWGVMSPPARAASGASLEALQQRIESLDTPWMRYLVARDPAVELQAMTCPTLVLFGQKDLQVDPAQNEPPLRKAFADGGKVVPTIVVLTDHNHLFQQSKTGKPSEYGILEETFSDAALAVIRDWLAQQVLPKKG